MREIKKVVLITLRNLGKYPQFLVWANGWVMMLLVKMEPTEIIFEKKMNPQFVIYRKELSILELR